MNHETLHTRRATRSAQRPMEKLLIASLIIASAFVVSQPASAKSVRHANFTQVSASLDAAIDEETGLHDEAAELPDDLYVNFYVEGLRSDLKVQATVTATREVKANCLIPFVGQVGPRQDSISTPPLSLVTDGDGKLVDIPVLLRTRLLGDVCPEPVIESGPVLVTDYSVRYSDVLITLTVWKASVPKEVEEVDTYSFLATFSSGDLEVIGLACTVETLETGDCGAF